MTFFRILSVSELSGEMTALNSGDHSGSKFDPDRCVPTLSISEDGLCLTVKEYRNAFVRCLGTSSFRNDCFYFEIGLDQDSGGNTMLGPTVLTGLSSFMYSLRCFWGLDWGKYLKREMVGQGTT